QGNDIAGIPVEWKIRLYSRELGHPASQKIRPGFQNSAANIGPDQLKQRHSKTKTRRRLGILIGKLAEAGQQYDSSQSCKRVLVARLAALAGYSLARDPPAVHKTPEQGVDQVVVQRLLPQDDPGFVLELIPVLGSRQQGRQDY